MTLAVRGLPVMSAISPNIWPGAELGEQELDARVGVLVADGDQPADDQEGGIAGAPFPDDGLLRRELAPPHPGLELGGFGRRQAREQRQLADRTEGHAPEYKRSTVLTRYRSEPWVLMSG